MEDLYEREVLIESQDLCTEYEKNGCNASVRGRARKGQSGGHIRV